jgi:myosin heavy subunit
VKSIVKIGLILLLGVVTILASVSCGGNGGISQEAYDSVLDKLADAQDEIAELTNELAQSTPVENGGGESSLEYENLQKDYDALAEELESAQDEYTALSAEYEGLMEEYGTLQSQNESNQFQIDLLQTERTQLQAQLNELLSPPPITTGDIEQALFARLNNARDDAGLVRLQSGKNLVNWSKANSEDMSVAKQTLIYDDSFVPYQQHFIATGYDTVDDLIAAVMTIWQSNATSYQNNVLADDALYGVVSVVKTGDIFYITFMASNFP